MEELKEEIKQIEDLWKKVYDVCVATPSLYTPHLPNLNLYLRSIYVYFIIIVVLKTMKLNVSNVSSMKRLMIYFMKWIYWGKEIKVLHYVIKK